MSTELLVVLLIIGLLQVLTFISVGHLYRTLISTRRDIVIEVKNVRREISGPVWHWN